MHRDAPVTQTCTAEGPSGAREEAASANQERGLTRTLALNSQPPERWDKLCVQATHSVGCCYHSPSELIHIPWQIKYAGPCPNMQQSSEIHQDLDTNLVYLYCSPVSSGAPEKRGLTPSTSFRGHREGAPHTQGGHPITLRPEPGSTVRPQLTPEAVRAGGHSGMQGRLSGLTPAPQALAAPHDASASPSHRGSETLPPAPISNALAALIMMTPGFWVFLSLLSAVKTQSIPGCSVIWFEPLCMAHIKENARPFASFLSSLRGGWWAALLKYASQTCKPHLGSQHPPSEHSWGVPFQTTAASQASSAITMCRSWPGHKNISAFSSPPEKRRCVDKVMLITRSFWVNTGMKISGIY